jgi:lipid II:glycine glycyltransferase (peptidoglycan interpeptide bridge formation enzyme)
MSPNSLLQWVGIRDAKASGARRYDFVGSDLPWLARYKAGFGAELREYPCLEFARPRLLFRLRDLYQRMRYRLPAGVRARTADLARAFR